MNFYAVRIVDTGDWYVVADKTPFDAGNIVLEAAGMPDREVEVVTLEAALWGKFGGIAMLQTF